MEPSDARSTQQASLEKHDKYFGFLTNVYEHEVYERLAGSNIQEAMQVNIMDH